MTKGDELTTDILADELLAQLSRSGWEFSVKDKQTFFDPDFNVFNKNGSLGAATELRVILISLSRRSTSIEIRFLFRMVDFNKRRLGKREWGQNGVKPFFE